MPNYAVYENDIIVNVIVADNQEKAEEAAGQNVFEVVKYPWIGWILVDQDWIPPQEDQWEGWSKVDGEWAPPSPYPSWNWNGEEWVAPIPRPEGKYRWDEETQSWVYGGDE